MGLPHDFRLDSNHCSWAIAAGAHKLRHCQSPATWAVIDRLRLQATTAGQVNPTRQNSEHACDFTSQTLGQTRHRHWWGQCLPITAVREIFGMPKPQPYPVHLKSNCAPPRLLSTSADSVCMVSLKQHAACKNRAAGLDVSATVHHHWAIAQQVPYWQVSQEKAPLPNRISRNALFVCLYESTFIVSMEHRHVVPPAIKPHHQLLHSTHSPIEPVSPNKEAAISSSTTPARTKVY